MPDTRHQIKLRKPESLRPVIFNLKPNIKYKK